MLYSNSLICRFQLVRYSLTTYFVGCSFLVPNKFIIPGWINSYHPNCMANLAASITSEDLLTAFSKRLTYYHKERQASDG